MELNAKVVSLKDIKPSQHNARKTFDEVKLKELAESIKEKGVIEPIIIRPSNGKFEVVCGERRYRASQLAGKKEIPAIIMDLNDQQALEHQVIENLQREDVHPLEEAEGYEALMKKYGYKTVDDIAIKIGKSRGYIYGRLKLCELIPENRKLFYENKLNPSVALLVARIPAHLQKEAGKKITAEGLDNEPMSYRRAQEFITKDFMLVLKAAPFDTDDAMLTEAAGSCTLCSKRTGNQKDLFPDISSADVCTDPVCFKTKKEAGIKRALAKAKESGKIILSEREAKKVFYSEDSMHLGEGYINLEAICAEDKHNRKYKQFVKSIKDVKLVVGINPHSGELVAMIHRTEAARIRKQLGIVPVKAEKETPKKDKAQKKEDRAKEQKQQDIQEKSTAKIVEAIISNVRKDTKLSFMRIMAEGMLEAYATPYVAFMFMKRRDPIIKRDDALKALKDHLDTISDSELPGFCLELIIHEGTEFGETNVLTNKLCKLYEIDTAVIRNTTAAEENKTKASDPIKPPEDARVKMRDGNTFEFDGAKGKKVVVKSKSKLSLDEQKKAGQALKQITDNMQEGDK
ncbi:MAG: ParB/RepB/Spo0J family partition protein [Candidatus Omnitrophica bacterium]|nr:ParB/RepB/Spo0J family partition protein [Candidatus Omnitrophota bacterium]